MMDLSLVLLASNSTELLWFKGEWFLLFLQLRGKWCLLILEGFSQTVFFFFFKREREFQPMASAPDDSSLSSDQDTNQFLA